jgi:hypothetical protein
MYQLFNRDPFVPLNDESGIPLTGMTPEDAFGLMALYPEAVVLNTETGEEVTFDGMPTGRWMPAEMTEPTL